MKRIAGMGLGVFGDVSMIRRQRGLAFVSVPSNSFSTSTNDHIDNPITLTDWGAKILLSEDSDEKASLTNTAFELWNAGKIKEVGNTQPPLFPGRPSFVKIMDPRELPQRGKGGTKESRVAMLHSFVHIENCAIDLIWDCICRFIPQYPNLPREFFDDFTKIAQDEAKHYGLLNERLKDLGSFYGAFPSHAGLWEDAQSTSHDLLARLAIENMVHEARGLDVTPKIITKYRSGGDLKTSDLLVQILGDEITHVRYGIRWFDYICKNFHNPPIDSISHFHQLVPRYFKGKIKGPFNTLARNSAGMTEQWYLPISFSPHDNKNKTCDEDES
eukprot:TRINITY_DN1975_c0_g1_i14.p1 TRINITY_DN1975_c0_g1~~TRINITY_DN1975_c0_g1_i14.p1  ORF type:complete len:329 (-),score=52.61 TRINITY_DN1975_c0_g1_i14:4-990(-)